MRVCAEPGCGQLTSARRCPTHSRETERARGTRQQRGYDAAYDEARRQYARRLDRVGFLQCEADPCIETSRVIGRGQAWDLGHNDERTIIRGPEHPRCNRSEGGKKRHRESAT